MTLPEIIVQKLESLPASPGVYVFKDKTGAVLYVGKAKSLRSRVRSYFQAGGSDARFFVPILQRAAADLETLVTATEKEAAILENSLIKQHQPRYNVKLRDDKNFISLRLGLDHPWPRLEVVRQLGRTQGGGEEEKPESVRARSSQQENARVFGPYHSATAARRALHLVNKHFQLRTCSDLELTSRRRPCLQYQIKRCPAPCVHDVDRAWYADQVRAVAMFLDGRHDELSRELVQKMKDAASSARYELAAVYRDQLRAIEAVREDQRIVSEDVVDRDVLGIHREGDLAELALLYIRAGRLADVATYSLKQAELPDEELVGGFLTQHYATLTVAATIAEQGAIVPSEIIVPILPDGVAGFAEWMSERAGRKVQVLMPKRGARVQLLELAHANARHAFIEKARTTDDVQDRLVQLQTRLRLPTLPRRIECCDISHLGGGDVVGAVVAMRDGVLDKSHYRSFHVRGTDRAAHLNDDYAAMYEVLARRFRRGLKPQASLAEQTEARPKSDGDGDWELPDLFVVDGGRGQLGVALAAARDLGLHGLPIVALAKERDRLPPKPPRVTKKNAKMDPKPAATGTESTSATETELAAEAGTEAALESTSGTGAESEKGTGMESEKGTETETELETGTESETGTAAVVRVVDRVYLPGQKNPIPLKSHSASLFFLARLRDEAHRFSNRARERLGKSRRFKSALDDVRGIGPALKRSLLSSLGSVAAIRAATDEELLKVAGVRPKHIQALRKALGQHTPSA